MVLVFHGIRLLLFLFLRHAMMLRIIDPSSLLYSLILRNFNSASYFFPIRGTPVCRALFKPREKVYFDSFPINEQIEFEKLGTQMETVRAERRTPSIFLERSRIDSISSPFFLSVARFFFSLRKDLRSFFSTSFLNLFSLPFSLSFFVRKKCFFSFLSLLLFGSFTNYITRRGYTRLNN